MQYAGAQQAADGVHGQQRIAHLQRDEQRHGQAGHADGTVPQPHGALLAGSQGVDGGDEEHGDLHHQRGVPGDLGAVYAALEAEQHRADEVDAQHHGLEDEQQPPGQREHPPEGVAFPQVVDDVARPEQYGQAHEQEVENRVGIGEGDQPVLVQQAPGDVRDEIEVDRQQEQPIGPKRRDELPAGPVQQHVVIDDEVDHQGE